MSGETRPSSGPVKCVIWDLDGTLWKGTLAEGDQPVVPGRNREMVDRLDQHGILQSVASRNDSEAAVAWLERLGLLRYFVALQVGWGPKSAAVRRVTNALGLDPGSVVFIDDSAFERAEVSAAIHAVRCLDPDQFHDLVDAGRVLPPVVTADGRLRRLRYEAEFRRREHEERFDGPVEEFLRSLRLRLRIAAAGPADLDRSVELIGRTNRLNTTGIRFSSAELSERLSRPDSRVLIARLTDRFGDYGQVGLAVVDVTPGWWSIGLLLMSCRVMGRNAGRAFLACLCGMAHREGAAVRIGYRPSAFNRRMGVTLRLAGFRPVRQEHHGLCYELAGAAPTIPEYFAVHIESPLSPLRSEAERSGSRR
jgi:FkbH-like protein